jgi:hypothetical protein
VFVIDTVIAWFRYENRRQGSGNRFDDKAAAVDYKGMSGGIKLPTRLAIETGKKLLNLRTVEAYW